jgi:hypothetical protein
LWVALSLRSGKDVSSLIAGWTQQMGYPVVKYSKKGNKLVVSQSKFLSSGKDENDKAVWKVPLRFVSINVEHCIPYEFLNELLKFICQQICHQNCKWSLPNSF